METNLEQFTQFARELAEESGALILKYYHDGLRGAGPKVMTKDDRSPVTVADQEAEALMRHRIEARYPRHGVMGEEAGSSGKMDSEFQWVLDPIDGTKSFVHGVPLFGTLIALVHDKEPILGVIHMVATGELMIGAQGRPTTVNGRPVRVRDTRSMDEATVLFTDLPLLQKMGYGLSLENLGQQGSLIRGWGDCYGHFLVAAGRADIMIDPQLSLWDLAALKPCVEGAGGRFTDSAGSPEGLGDSAISTNGHLHDEIIAALNKG